MSRLPEDQRRLHDLWQTRIKEAIKARERYDEQARRTLRFFEAKHGKFYESDDVSECFVDFRGSAAVSVCKAGQARSVLGPYLYQTNPKRVVRTRTTDPVLVTLAKILEAYLNYTPRETGLQQEARRSIDDALLRGRGFLWTQVDDTTGLVTSKSVSSIDVLLDPEARSLEQCLWVALRRTEPPLKVRRRVLARARAMDREQGPDSHYYEQQARMRLRGLGGDDEGGDAEDTEHFSRYREESEDERRSGGRSPRLKGVTTWTIWSKWGLGWRDAENATDRARADKDDFVMLEVEDGMAREAPLYVGPWESRIYLDDAWPITHLDFVPTPDALWPVSVFGQAESHMAALDLCASLELQIGKVRARQVVFYAEDALDDTGVEIVKHGGPDEMVPVKVPRGGRLQDAVFRFDLGSIGESLSRIMEFHERQFDLTTGMVEAISGVQAQQDAVERSATASSLKHQAAATRIGAFREEVENFSAQVARNEAVIVRIEQDPDAVQRVVRDLVEFPWLVSVRIEGGELPMKRVPRAPGSPKDRRVLQSVYEIEPAAATYFATPDEAEAALALLVRSWARLANQDPEIAVTFSPLAQALFLQAQAQQGLADEAVAQGQIESVIGVRQATVHDVWRDTSGMSPREIVREYGYEVAVGSTRRLDPAAKIDLANSLMSNVLPVLIQTGNIDGANALLRTQYDALDVPDESRAYLPLPAPVTTTPAAPAPQEAAP